MAARRGAAALLGALRASAPATAAPAFASTAAASTLAAAAAAPSSSAPAAAPAFLRRLGLGLGLAGAAAATTAASLTAVACAPGEGAATAGGAASATTGIDLSRAGVRSLGADQRTVVFVLGGPGSGKGTQCARLVSEFGVVHLSAGDLLRAHCASGTPDGTMVADMIKNGQIVPSRVTISLLEAAMASAVSARGGAPTTFLVDGFPRNAENRAAYEAQTGVEPAFILFFDCPEAVMSRRLAGRQQGRTDDNAATIAKRFAVFRADSMPVVQHYEALGKVRRVDADRSPDEVYAEVRQLFL